MAAWAHVLCPGRPPCPVLQPGFQWIRAWCWSFLCPSQPWTVCEPVTLPELAAHLPFPQVISSQPSAARHRPSEEALGK